jgi:hypothetical protein
MFAAEVAGVDQPRRIHISGVYLVAVIAGHSPSKTGVNALVPRQSIFFA